MILAVSRFRVANLMERQVAEAFFNRPRLVEGATGFHGMETFTDSQDGAVFYLVTRWTDAESFRAWHKSADHRLSHRFIPKGLKLDPQFTRLLILERLSDPGNPMPLEDAVADSSGLFTRCVSESECLFFLIAAPDGAILIGNDALARCLRVEKDGLRGKNVRDILTVSDASVLRREVAEGGRRDGEPLLLNFVDADSHPFTLTCHLAVRPDSFTLLGTPLLEKEQALKDELLKLNNRLAVMNRENARRNKMLERAHEELRKAHEDLEKSHWHLRKIQEVLPICVMCSRVKTGEGHWDELIKFFKSNSDFLSHGYCPECGARAMRQLEGSKPKDVEGG